MAKLSLTRYETQIKVFFILLILILLIINIMNFYLLSSSRNILIASETKRAKVLSDAALREMEEGGATEIIAGSGRIEFPVYSSYLRRSAIRNGLSSLAILDEEGRIIVSSESYTTMQKDGDFEELAPTASRSLRSGIGIHSFHEGGEIINFLPIAASGGTVTGFLKSVYFDLSLERETRNYRILIYSQAAVIIIILVLVLFFWNWVSKPFRAFGEAASRLPDEIKKEWGWTNEPILVEESFRNVLEKIVEQEEVLKRIHQDAEDPAESAEAFIERVAKEMVSGVVYLDSKSGVITMNPEAEKIIGIDRETVRGKSLFPLATHIEGLSELVNASLKEGKKFSREVLGFVKKDGRKGHLGVAITPVRGVAGNIVGALCMLTDLTEIQSLQERGRLRENLAAVGAVSAGIAHEFRNSLGAILAYAKLIARETDANDSQENASAIVKEVEASRRVVDDFLFYTRPTHLSLSTVDLKGILHELKDEIENSKQLANISLEIKGDEAEVSADELLLKQVFLNIVKNAAEAYDKKSGKVEILIERLAEKRVKIAFIDHAGGITDEQLEKIFIPFFSTKKSGTGLGLALAQKIVVNHDGIIEAENRKGMGLTMRVILPAKTMLRE